jgi:hypothetical protein
MNTSDEKNPVEEQDQKNLDDEFERVEREQKLKQKENPTS